MKRAWRIAAGRDGEGDQQRHYTKSFPHRPDPAVRLDVLESRRAEILFVRTSNRRKVVNTQVAAEHNNSPLWHAAALFVTVGVRVWRLESLQQPPIIQEVFNGCQDSFRG